MPIQPRAYPARSLPLEKKEDFSYSDDNQRGEMFTITFPYKSSSCRCVEIYYVNGQWRTFAET